MPFLTSDHGRHELTPGTHIVGGRDAGSVPLRALREMPAAAAITVSPPAAPVIRRLAPDLVKINGRRLGKRARLMRDGMRIEIGSVLLTYAAASPERRQPPSEAATVLAAGVEADDVPARLVDVRSGRAYDLRRGEIVIGRSSTCDIVIDGDQISRRHLRLTVGQRAVHLIDESANGTWVNGERVESPRTLQPGDVVRMGAVELRYEPTAPVNAAGPVAVRDGEPLATLEVIGGKLSGTTYNVMRRVCSLGRGKDNDVRVKDDSVSTAHATLMMKADSWVVVDLRSVNGTFVDSYRVAGERVLPAGCTLRVGSVKMRFRPAVVAPPEGYGTRRVVGLGERLSKLINE
ncbi:MAG: FHA domain-containing protein [Gemmatimonadaceae bacterium]